MNQEIDSILTTLEIQPVLMDIGASGAPPPQWLPIAHHSVYIGFDPDLRDLQDIADGAYARSVMMNAAATSESNQEDVTFYFTTAPHCSSTLEPDTESLTNYLFAGQFVVEREAKVRSVTINSVMEQLGLPHIDWFKVDSQGTDLRLFQSIDSKVRDNVLAVDIEPGFIDVYKGEDLFVDAQRQLLSEGFWLSTLEVRGSARIRQDTLAAITQYDPRVDSNLIHYAVRPSPGWCGARYLRTLDFLTSHHAEPRSFGLLWVFAMIERHWGYALDIAQTYQKLFGQSPHSTLLFETPLREIYRNEPRLRLKKLGKQVIPRWLIRRVKELGVK